jgi:DNA-binding MarR family transcriptional regulator
MSDRVRIGLLFQIFRTNQVSGRLVQHALEGTGLRGDDYAVYSYLLQRPMTLTELADGTGLPLTTAAGYVKRFEERGHVERSPNPKDGRSQLLSLTTAGRRLTQQVAVQFGAEIKRLDDVIALQGIDSVELTDQLRVIQGLIETALEDVEDQ